MKNFLKRFLLTLLLLVLLFWLKTAWAGADGVFPWFDPITTLLQVLLALLAGTQAIERVASSLYPNTLPLSVEQGRVLFYGVPVTALSFWNKVRHYFLFRWLSESREIHYSTAMLAIQFEGAKSIRPFPDPGLLHRQLADFLPTQFSLQLDKTLRLRPERKLLQSLLGNPDEDRRILVMAEAGMGKSSLLARIMQDYLRTRFWQHPSAKKAIFSVPLKYFDALFLETNFTAKNLLPSNCILLLDALDEDAAMYTDSKSRWAEINRLCSDFYKVILTTRTELFHGEVALDTPNWDKLYLRGFAQRQQRKYLRRRCYSLGRSLGGAPDYAVGRAILKRSVSGLFARPFLLAALVELIKNQSYRKRYAYDCEVLDDLIDAWLKNEENKALGLPREQLETFLKDLACDMVGIPRRGADALSIEEKERLENGFITDSDLQRRILAANLTESLLAHSLLCRPSAENPQEGILCFAHQILRDYLAARHQFGQVWAFPDILKKTSNVVWPLYNQLCWARIMPEEGHASDFGLLDDKKNWSQWLKKRCGITSVPWEAMPDTSLLPLRAFLLNLPQENLKSIFSMSREEPYTLLRKGMVCYIEAWATAAQQTKDPRFGPTITDARRKLERYLAAWALAPFESQTPKAEDSAALSSIAALPYSLLRKERTGKLAFKHPLLEQAFLAYCCEMGHSLALDTLRPSSLLWAAPFRTQLFEKVTRKALGQLKGDLLRQNGHFAGREWAIKLNDEQYDYAQPPLLEALGPQAVPDLEALESARALYLSAEGAKETVRLPWVLGFCDQLETLMLRECGDLHTLDQLGLALEENELPETLRVLCLWGTGIKNLKGIDPLKALDTLQVCGSKLSEIPQLSGLPHLKWIRLTHGEITEVPYDLQDHLPPTTQLLDLSGNTLQVDGPLAADGHTPDYWAWQVDWGKVLQRQFGHPVRLLYLLPDTPYWADIPEGTLRFGDEPEGADERELLAIGAFKMSRFLLTVAQFHAFVQHQHYVQPEISHYGEKGSYIIDQHEKTHDFRKDIGYLHNEYGDLLKPYEYGRPVLHVSWHDAQACAQWYHARLPSEAEWEYAAKANTKHSYAGGEDLDALGWFIANSAGHAQPVGQKVPNGFGLFDLSGNAWEWCEDLWREEPGQYASETGLAEDSSGSFRVNRGGSWGSIPRTCRASDRRHGTPDRRGCYLGFRLARTR